MRRFKNGAFQLAIDAKVPVLPITFKNNYSLFTDHKDLSGNAKPGIAKIVIHNPIETTNLSRKELVSLRDHTFNIIKTELDNLFTSSILWEASKTDIFFSFL